jgi:hypothetical protein
MSTARPVRLPDRFYLPRTDNYGREVRDVMPWEGAVSYATDGERLGVQYGDGRVEWLGRATTLAEDGPAHDSAADPLSILAADFEGVNLDALVDGIRSYMDLHPVLKTVWRDDVQRLETLRERSHEDES